MNAPDYMMGRDHVTDEGDVLPIDRGTDWQYPTPDEGFPLQKGIGAEVALRVIENAGEMQPVTGICSKSLERYTNRGDWELDLTVLHNLGLDMFSAEDYATLRSKDADTFQRVMRKFRAALDNHRKRIEQVQGDETLAPNLINLYGRRTPQELMTLAHLLEQLARDIDQSSVIDPSQEKTARELRNAPDYLDVLVTRGNDGRLKLHRPVMHLV